MATKTLRRSVYSAFLVSAILTYYVSADDVEWRYFGIYGVKNWSAIYPDCNAANHTRQSPVDIVRAETEENTDLTQIHLVVDQINGPLTMVNNGHTVNFDFNKTTIHISGGDLPGKFWVGGVHFHWGRDDTEGSEHTIDGKVFPLEMHVATWDKTRYSGVMEAAKGVNSVAVISTLFQVSAYDNSALNPIVSHLQNVTTEGQPITIPYFDVTAIWPLNKRYYRYLGSFTTPPCSESIVWSIFEDQAYISSSQLAKFRMLNGYKERDGKTEHMEDNRRTTQPLDGRKIQRSGIDSIFNKMAHIALIMTLCVVLQLFV